MQLFETATTACCIALMSAILAPRADAGDLNRKPLVTLSGPVEIPGVHLTGCAVLTVGTYVFEFLNSSSDGHIDKTVLTSRERPAGESEALRVGFYPGRNWGEEFVCPKARAIAIARETYTPFLFTPAEMPVEVAEPIKSADAPVVLSLKAGPIMAIQPSGEEVQVAAALPATASALPLVGLLGLIALGGAFAFRKAERRVQ